MPTPLKAKDVSIAADEIFDPPTHSPDPLLKLLVGPWSTIYTSYTYLAENQPPHPGITLGIFHFDEMRQVKGTLLPNFGGKAIRISFKGTYSLGRESGSGLVRGAIQIMLPDVPAPPPPTIPERFLVVLQYVLRDKGEIDWVLVGAEDPQRVVVSGGKMFRINTRLGRVLPKPLHSPGSTPSP